MKYQTKAMQVSIGPYYQIHSKQQGGTECGQRTLLHILLANHCNKRSEFAIKLGKLEQVNKLKSRTRKWAQEIAKKELTMPDWIREITNI